MPPPAIEGLNTESEAEKEERSEAGINIEFEVVTSSPSNAEPMSTLLETAGFAAGCCACAGGGAGCREIKKERINKINNEIDVLCSESLPDNIQ